MGMKFRCERDTLLEALTVAVRATAGTSSNRAALTGVHFDLQGDTLTVTGSDLDLTLSVTAEVAGEGEGAAVTPAPAPHRCGASRSARRCRVRRGGR